MCTCQAATSYFLQYALNKNTWYKTIVGLFLQAHQFAATKKIIWLNIVHFYKLNVPKCLNTSEII